MATTSTAETVLADFGNRKLIRFECCGCDETFELCLTETSARLCLDCRADEDRIAHGWTPENSIS